MIEGLKEPTELPGLDRLTHGGIPRQRATLLVGKSGTGKTLLALQVACGFARRGLPAIYCTVEERPSDLQATADALGFCATDSQAAGKLTFVDLRRDASRRVVAGEYDVSGLVDRLRAMGHREGLVVIDSLTAMFQPRPNSESLRGQLSELIFGIEDLGLTLVLISEATSDYAAPTLLGVEDFLCDAILVVRNAVDGKRRRRTIEVHKYRRSQHYKGEYPMAITGEGLHIFPLDAPDYHELPVERFSSGVDGLDTMTDGGWYRDSIVLARGPTGSGKTTVAGTYCVAGARRGERVVYYGFEEPRQVLLRNFSLVGLDLLECERAGNLRLVCRHPEASSPEDLLIDLRRDLMAFQPSLIVIDSISAIEHSNSVEGFRIFLVGVAALLREHRRSALLTQTISSKAEARSEPPFLSTLADAILMLDYEADQPRLERSIRVLKMRGSSHSSDQRHLELTSSGLLVRGDKA